MHSSSPLLRLLLILTLLSQFIDATIRDDDDSSTTMTYAARGDPAHLCRARFFQQPKDQFAAATGSVGSWSQRVFYNFDNLKPGGPLFFYFGNEANVELYIDHTGLMWENAKRFGAGLVFAEHRYFGLSRVEQQSSSSGTCSYKYLTTDQALADYARVVSTLRKELNPIAVIGFGGSYGGMLAAWFKFRYPHLVNGVIAASAPILAYLHQTPPYDANGFARVVTKDAGPACATSVKRGFTRMKEMASAGGNGDELKTLSRLFHTCRGIRDEREADDLIEYVSGAFDYLAMGNYPYASSYVTPRGEGLLPAWPMKYACENFLAVDEEGDEEAAVRGLAQVAALYYNSSGKASCLYNGDEKSASFSSRLASTRPRRVAKTECEGSWDFLYCAQHVMPFTKGTPQDMFYPRREFDLPSTLADCEARYGVTPSDDWATLSFGGLAGLRRGLRNAVLSNGLLDPWSSGGVTSARGFDASVHAVTVPSGAHHLDLMFSDPAKDPKDVVEARKQEMEFVRGWIAEARRERAAAGETVDAAAVQ